MSQKQILINKQQQASNIKTILSQRSTDELRLAAPFTVFVKKISNNTYSWIVYSIGRPRNIVWGVMDIKTNGITIDYGCAWNSLGILNKMIEIRKKNGYVAVSTYAKDMINERILGDLIGLAYNKRTSLQYADIFLDYRQLNLLVLDHLLEQGITEDTSINVAKIARPLALSLLKNPNIAQILPDSMKIPKSVIDTIHDFIGHASALTSNLPEMCPEYDDCEQNPEVETCNLYSDTFALL